MPRRRSRTKPSLGIFLVLAAIAVAVFIYRENTARRPGTGPGVAGEYLFCFWNVENLFDDRFDERKGQGDAEYDGWFARDPAALRAKLDRLCTVLLELNDGKGPDILAVVEVESERGAELLQQALNARLSDVGLHYSAPLMRAIATGRHIAPAIITRLPVERNRTQLLNKRLRILEGHLHVNNQPLVVIASHWTSRLTDEVGLGRDKYADQIYGRFKAMYLSNPQVDLLICGDFNDSPDDDSVVKQLRATGDQGAVLQSTRENPFLYNLSARRDPKQFGTHYYRRWLIFDQIVASPGLLDDQGWTVLPDTLRTINSLHRPNDRLRRPWSFGKEKDKGERGYSDHFPVTVRLRVAGG